MDQVTVSKEEDVAEPTYHQGSNPIEPVTRSTSLWMLGNVASERIYGL
jgi:hypothetical protein